LNYINLNGRIIPETEPIVSAENRAFRYGDGLFETMLWQNADVRFLPFHVERLQKSMAMLLFDEVGKFDEFFIRSETEELIRRNNMIGQRARVRLTVFRDGGGLYAPQTNRPAFCLQVSRIPALLSKLTRGLIVDLYTDHRKPTGELSRLKSNNALLFVMAGWFKKKHGYDEAFVLNERGNLCEATASNVFVFYDGALYTPALTEGCVDGVMRRAVMDVAGRIGIPAMEAQIHPEILERADEVFCTNAVQGVQWVMGYKRKRYFNRISKMLQKEISRIPKMGDANVFRTFAPEKQWFP